MESKITTSSTSATTSSSQTTYTNSYEYNYEHQYFYLSRIRPWCLGTKYDFCPLMIVIMIVVILISAVLIAILCIHNRKPYITRLLINYIVNKKNRIFGCKKTTTHSHGTDPAHRQASQSAQHSAIHNSIFWVNNQTVLQQHQQAPPSYEESVLMSMNQSSTTAATTKPVYFTSILAPIVNFGQQRTTTATVNNAFENDNYLVPQVRQYRECAVDTIELPENNYYENRRINRKNLSFMSTDSFHFINTSANRSASEVMPSTSSLPTQTSSTTSTLRSQQHEYPPAYDTLLIAAQQNSSFTKLGNDIDNLNKFKKLQQRYQQSASQSRKQYYQQRQAKQQQQQNRQSTATILSEVEIIV